MINVTMYVKKDCPACDQAIATLQEMQAEVPHQLVKIDVDSDPALRERFNGNLPVVEIGPYRLKSPFERQELLVAMLAARDRVNQMEKVNQAGYQQMLAKGGKMTAADRLSYWLSNHYLLLVNFFLLLYAGLPFLAPVLMKTNLPLPASIIYKIYSPMCHQLAFRSWFLFGEQAYYPRELAGMQGVMSYERLMNEQQVDVFQAREFIGSETVGYKVALCERDVAIYGAMLLFGIVYSLIGRKIRMIPWYVWVVLGLVPIGIDGVSQLPSIASGLPSWILMRESTPFLRTLTGALFGWMTAWYLFPMIEETMRETRRILQRKQAVIERANQAG